MANRREGRPSIVQWDRIRKFWVRNSRDQSSAQQYFSTFWTSHKNYQFTVAKAYYGLYELGVTCEQYDALKNELQSRIGYSLPGINCTELMRENGADIRKKSFKNHSEYGAYQRSFVQANNRRIVSEKRSEVAAHFEKAKGCLEESSEKLIVAFDLEVYEYDKDKVLEIGYVAVKLGTPAGSAAPEIAEKCHLIIEENLELKNKDFVADNRDGFRFGSSETVALEAAVEKFQEAVKKCAFLVAHASSNDEAYLRNVGLDLSELKKEIMDTQQIEQHKEFAASSYAGGDRLYLRGLGRLLQSYAVSHKEEDLHNAGCDAYYTMKVFLRQMGHGVVVVNSLS